MPYELRGTTVINSATGKPVPGGKHPNRKKALAHLRALMANVPDAKTLTVFKGAAGQPGSVPVLAGKPTYDVDAGDTPGASASVVQPHTGPSLTARTRSVAPHVQGANTPRTNKESSEQIVMSTRQNGHGATYEANSSMLSSLPHSFAVFKDARGEWRWIARTTTAFEDRDNEIISTKALDEDVARADADGLYGPLRWWHMGKPDPLDKAAPWGPGVDLGWTDFNAMSGKTLIESGTFKSEAVARAIAAKADELELSPGFFHAANEPDQTGVFTHIHRFERSLVPTWAGHASNYYTGLIVKGKAMDEKKIQALKDLGIDQKTIDGLVADVQQTEKAAEADGVRYKEATPIKDFFVSLLRGEPLTTTKEEEAPAAEAAPEAQAEAATDADPIEALKAQVEALTAEVATLKAFGKPDEPAKEEETVVQEDAFGDAPAEEAPADDGGGDSPSLSSADLAAIGQIITAALEPLIGALGITSKLEGHLGELKTMMGGYAKTKDDAASAQAEEIAALKASIDQAQAKLADLVGSETRAGYKASEATDNIFNPQVLAAITNNGNTNNGEFSDIVGELFPGIARR